ncbi:MAG: insulinase family protein [Deltaproteobacteria bacterium]|nr:insulinase family protein [Deltaproteobacteria bacterium]
MSLKRTSRSSTSKGMLMSNLFFRAGHFCILVFSLMVCTQALATEETPKDLYDIEYYQLPNGLSVLLKERRQAESVSFRVVVNIGMADYSCGRKETPHFLEHLLISGTQAHTESQHDDLIAENGGEWNAYAAEEETVYTIDIGSRRAAIGLEALHDIITDSRITQENVDNIRNIVHRESGGEPTIYKQWFDKLFFGFPGGEVAHKKLLEGTTYACLEPESVDDIKESDLREAQDRYYVAKNMAIIAVGDFDSAGMKKIIESAFGEMRAGERIRRPIQVPNPVSSMSVVTGTFSPVIGNEALAGVAYASGGKQSPDYYSRWFIEKYLADRLYKKLRVEEGISYAPSVERISYSDIDVWFAYADTELYKVDEAVGLIQLEIDQLVNNGVSEELLSAIKNRLLSTIAQGYESNREIADFYVESLHEIQKFGDLTRREEKINALSVSDIQRVASQIFAKAPPIVFRDTPTLTYTQLIVLLGVFALFVGYFIYRFVSRRVFSQK